MRSFLTWAAMATATAGALRSQQQSEHLAAPVRLQADGAPIDIGKLSKIAHAGPWLGDLDADGDRDLLVGDFPGYFWRFDNVGTDREPEFTVKGMLQAGGKAAKTPVY